VNTAPECKQTLEHVPHGVFQPVVLHCGGHLVDHSHALGAAQQHELDLGVLALHVPQQPLRAHVRSGSALGHRGDRTSTSVYWSTTLSSDLSYRLIIPRTSTSASCAAADV
jgi:hypothetical protein